MISLTCTQKDSICVIHYEDQTAFSNCFYCQANLNNNIIVSLFPVEKKILNNKEFWQGILVSAIKWCSHTNHKLLSKNLNHSCRKCALLSKLHSLIVSIEVISPKLLIAWIHEQNVRLNFSVLDCEKIIANMWQSLNWWTLRRNNNNYCYETIRILETRKKINIVTKYFI